MPANEGWIGYDLDGTLAEYDGWQGIEHIGKPIKPMITDVKSNLEIGISVKIFTARVAEKNPEKRMYATFYIMEWCKKHIGKVLPVTNEKDFGMIRLIDDRCEQVLINKGEFALSRAEAEVALASLDYARVQKLYAKEQHKNEQLREQIKELKQRMRKHK